MKIVCNNCRSIIEVKNESLQACKVCWHEHDLKRSNEIINTPFWVNVFSSMNQQSFRLNIFKGRYYWDNNLIEYSPLEYTERISHNDESEALEFAHEWKNNLKSIKEKSVSFEGF